MRTDLKKHVMVGAVVGAFVAVVTENPLGVLCILLGYAAALAVGWVKELFWDEFLGRGVRDPQDAHYTGLGGLLGALLGFLVGWLLL